MLPSFSRPMCRIASEVRNHRSRVHHVTTEIGSRLMADPRIPANADTFRAAVRRRSLMASMAGRVWLIAIYGDIPPKCTLAHSAAR
jgi:hypothetical protein